MLKENSNEWKAAKPMIWIRTEDGNTWVCPKDAISDPNNVSADELAMCVNESYNPQNN